MPEKNKETVGKVNKAFSEGNFDAFFDFCADDLVFTIIGDRSVKGKEAARQFMRSMAAESPQPPKITSVGPLIAAGPIVAALAGVGSGGVVGGLIGAFAGMGIPEFEAKRYEGLVKEGGLLLSVHCDNGDWADKAKVLLKRTGAEDVSSAGEASADYAKTDKPMKRGASAT